MDITNSVLFFVCVHIGMQLIIIAQLVLVIILITMVFIESQNIRFRQDPRDHEVCIFPNFIKQQNEICHKSPIFTSDKRGTVALEAHSVPLGSLYLIEKLFQYEAFSLKKTNSGPLFSYFQNLTVYVDAILHVFGMNYVFCSLKREDQIIPVHYQYQCQATCTIRYMRY